MLGVVQIKRPVYHTNATDLLAYWVCLRPALQKAYGSDHTLVTFVLVVVVARFNSWDHIFATDFRFMG